MITLKKYIFIGFICLACSNQANIFAQDAISVINSLSSKIKKINTLSVQIDTQERFGKEMKSSTAFYKICYSPFKVYTKQKSPVEGLEVLFIKGHNNDNAIINPNSFPYVNVNFSPYSSTMRDGFHLTLYQAGYRYFGDLMDHLVQKYSTKLSTICVLKPKIKFKNTNCGVIEMNIPDFAFTSYTVLNGENIVKIAQKFKVSDYKILEKNNIKFYTDVKPGQKIQIPSDYAKKIILTYDEVLMIPIKIEVFDEIGLFEKYEFSSVKINPVYKSDEFSEDFNEYNF